jgi:glycine dehydrogenase
VAHSSAFAQRHIGPDKPEQQRMLDSLGYASLDELTSAALPASLAARTPLQLPDPLNEDEVLDRLRALAAKNQVLTSMIGLGYYGTITPPVIRRNVLESPAWYTAYTPYQPEISQGRLEALLNFQTMVEDLTALPVAGASMLDEATAAAEAMTLAHRAPNSPAANSPAANSPAANSRSTKKGTVFLADADCLPQTLAVLATRAEPLGLRLVTGEITPELVRQQPAGELFGILLQYPGASGQVKDLRPAIEAAHAAGALAVVAADPLALTLLAPPGELGADIAIGSTQRFGVPMGYGGPHAGYICVRDDLKRQLPGRLVGVSVDADGHPAYRLALQAREQHIRREKATSNICTAQVLLAVIAAMYAAYHGPDGLRAIAERVAGKAASLAALLREKGFAANCPGYFDTVGVLVPGDAEQVVERARAAGYNLRLAGPDLVQIACDETTTDQHIADVAAAITGTPPVPVHTVPVPAAEPAIPAGLRRTSAFLTHPVFGTHHSETSMLRYLRKLADFDIAIDRSMIPLGSCTMKLNATAEMEPISWREFAGLHPFAPADQAEGYHELIAGLSDALTEITGYDAVSLQPNAGSQGELAGLLAIRHYHRANDAPQRTVCLIPESAHGTNAASAVLAGLRVVVVKCGSDGAIDLGDLRAKLETHAGAIAAIMLTYPSTNGVYESTVAEVADLVHAAGGQVYVDGANLNALVGLARPAEFGADVSHLNLHKTFCIPHGGGGPGVGPVAVRAHLAPFLPGTDAAGPVSAAPYGSAGILPISWAYVAMMGATGLRLATQVAILNANYIAKRLGPYFPVLYTGQHGLVAHECILDLRQITAQVNVTAEDVAKRLIDYGFHAPTMSFPVAGTLMVEPTESENLAEIDRFCDAIISIAGEIAKIGSGEYDPADNPLKNAPHTASMLLADEWEHGYSRTEAAYPNERDRRSKYWPPVRRIEAAYGDRNLVCACPPPEAFE